MTLKTSLIISRLFKFKVTPATSQELPVKTSMDRPTERQAMPRPLNHSQEALTNQHTLSSAQV